MSRTIELIREARHAGRLQKYFRAADVRNACPRMNKNTASTFLPKHAIGNPDGNTEYFKRRTRGLYSLIEE